MKAAKSYMQTKSLRVGYTELIFWLHARTI